MKNTSSFMKRLSIVSASLLLLLVPMGTIHSQIIINPNGQRSACWRIDETKQIKRPYKSGSIDTISMTTSAQTTLAAWGVVWTNGTMQFTDTAKDAKRSNSMLQQLFLGTGVVASAYTYTQSNADLISMLVGCEQFPWVDAAAFGSTATYLVISTKSTAGINNTLVFKDEKFLTNISVGYVLKKE